MPETLLRTKLFVPPLRPNLVPRSHLIERLNQGLQLGHKLTLISAPAGFGKTTLASEWVGHLQMVAAQKSEILNRSAWLSLDEGDNDPARFLTYFITALNRVEGIEAAIGQGALSMLQSPQPPPAEAVLTSLINDIPAIPHSIILVLDDYHLIEAQPIQDVLSFFLENTPPQMHLVIATREDPNLPLARLRARGHLTELRAADLRFNPGEAAKFLNQVMDLNLPAEEIAALETRTEGWIAGLQMAALSMQGREDTASFIQAFTGSHHFVLDYLVEEVLQRQPNHVSSFLLQTSILDRLSGPLCNAVTRQEDSKGMLESLERGNLFVVPLDDKRQLYRYHHLFADVLYAHLLEEQPDQVPALHRRASSWYEQNGLPSNSIRHALAAEEFDRAAGLIELAWPAMEGSFQSATWLSWVKVLPDELVRARPVLSVWYAWALLDGGELEASEDRLLDAESWLASYTDLSEQPEAPSAEMIIVDEEQFRSLPATIANARAYHALALGDVPATVKYARRVLDLLSEGDHQRRGSAAGILGCAYWTTGDLEAAHRTFTDCVASLQMAGNNLLAISVTTALADIRVVQGRLREAVSAYEQSLHYAKEQGDSALQVIASLHLGLGVLRHEQGNQQAATQHLLRSKDLGEHAVLADWPYRWCLAQASTKEAQGDLDGALDQLHEAERVYFRNPIPDVRPVAALRTRVWARQSRLTEALGWVRERDLSVEDDLSYLREFEHVTLARVLIAQYRSNHVDSSIHGAVGLLGRLLKAAEEGGRTGSVIEILVLLALAHEAQGDMPTALVFLERALTLAAPEGYVRIFVDEGPPMAPMLREAAKLGTIPDYISQLRAAFGQAEGSRPITQLLIDPLSKRELEVLGLLGTELNGPEIARELRVSLTTMRTHTRNIYSKLGVNNRRMAVRRAEELDLL